MANRNWPNNKLYQYEIKPVLLTCNFVVDSTNGNGLGIRSLKGSGINAVYMHTSATPAPGNPNPSTGVIQVDFTDTYNRYLAGFSGQVMLVGSSSNTPTGAGSPEVITSLGTTTLAQWQAAGLPVGVVPAVGAAFVSKTSGAIGGTGTVAPPVASGIDHIEVVGDPNQTIISPIPLLGRQPVGPQSGGQILLQCQFEGAATAPANGAVIGLAFLLSDSSIQINGQ